MSDNKYLQDQMDQIMEGAEIELGRIWLVNLIKEVSEITGVKGWG